MLASVRQHHRLPLRLNVHKFPGAMPRDASETTTGGLAGREQSENSEQGRPFVEAMSETTSNGMPKRTMPGMVLRQFDSAATRGSLMMSPSVLGHNAAAAGSAFSSRRHRHSIQVTYLPIRLDISGFGQVWSDVVHAQIEAACCADPVSDVEHLDEEHGMIVNLVGGDAHRQGGAPVPRPLAAPPTEGVTLSTAVQRVSSRWPLLVMARLKRLRLLGSGGFGDVYEAVDVMGGGHFALKQFKKDTVQREEVRNEITALSIIPPHPGIMRLALCIASEKSISMITELVDGVSLDNVISGRSRLREDALQIVVAELISAMERIHLSGLVHRDIKPENLMITSAESGAHVKVLDFGLAERVDVPRALLNTQKPKTQVMSAIH